MREKKILINYLLYIFLFIGICIVGISRPLAATIKAIYPTNNFSQNANNYLKLNESGTFGITNTNLTIQGQSYGFNFFIQENVVLNKTYTIVITFMADDLRSDFQNNYVHVNVGSGSTSSSVAIVSISRNNPTGYSTTLTIKFNPLTTGDYIQVSIISDGPPYAVLTGVSTYGIKNVSLDSSADSQDIINNQNQNTQDIINSQQSSSSLIINSQQSSASAIQDSINSLNDNFNTTIQCNNLYNGNNISVNGTFSTNNATNLGSMAFDVGTYTISLTNNLTNNSYIYIGPSGTILSGFRGPKTSFSVSTASTYNIWFIRTAGSYNNFTSNIKIEKGNSATTYCVYGSSSSVNKLDQQTNAINDLNDLVNSDNIDSSSASSFFSNFTDNTHGLSGVVSAPLVAINAMLNNQCSPLTATWKETTVSLPCGYDFWSRMTGFQQFLNIALDGLLCYRILVKIFKLVEKFKNPNDDRVEVMDL